MRGKIVPVIDLRIKFGMDCQEHSRDTTPAVILSSLAESGTRIALDALEAGAIAVFCKPSGAIDNELSETMPALCEAIKGAALAELSVKRSPVSRRIEALSAIAKPPPTAPLRNNGESRIIAIGASTGGTDALRIILTSLPPDCPPVLAVVHMPEGFTGRFAERLDGLCEIDVREARNGDVLTPGLALIARGNHHLLPAPSGNSFCVHLSNGPLVCRHRPSVEVLFTAIARTAGPRALGIILTGMGSDGASGLLAMRQAGAHTIAQDEASCVVFGMPREAIAVGAACEILPLQQIGAACLRWARQPGEKKAHPV